MDSYGVKIGHAWCCGKACEICILLVQKNFFKRRYFLFCRVPKQKMIDYWLQGNLGVNVLRMCLNHYVKCIAHSLSTLSFKWIGRFLHVSPTYWSSLHDQSPHAQSPHNQAPCDQSSHD
jgi:hypothetical protein